MVDPETGKDVAFESMAMDRNIPSNCIPVVEKISISIVGSFRLATIGAFREIYRNAKPVILEPIMNIEVVASGEFQSASLEIQSSCFAI